MACLERISTLFRTATVGLSWAKATLDTPVWSQQSERRSRPRARARTTGDQSLCRINRTAPSRTEIAMPFETTTSSGTPTSTATPTSTGTTTTTPTSTDTGLAVSGNVRTRSRTVETLSRPEGWLRVTVRRRFFDTLTAPDLTQPTECAILWKRRLATACEATSNIAII